MAENGDGGQMMIVLLLGVVVMMCLSSCCSSLLTAYANECDTDGMFSMFAGDWYWNLVPSTGVLGCGSSGTTEPVASTTENTTEQIEENKSNQPTTSGGTSDSKCNIGTEANYDYRVREKDSNGDWKCPSGWHDTKCGLVSNADGKWVDGDTTGAKQCRKRKSGTTGSNSSSASSNSECVTLIHKDGSKDLCFIGGANHYKHSNLKEIGLDDNISNVTVPKGISLQFWEHPNYGGRQTAAIVGPVTNLDLGEIAFDDGSYGIKNKASTLQFWKNSSPTSNDASSTSNDTSSMSLGDVLNKLGTSSTSTDASSGVTLYRDTKYGGKSKRHGTINVSNASDTGMNNVISSMKISPGYVLKGYYDKNFKGKSKKWESDTNWIGTTWNDKISSYKIYKK